MTWLTLRQYRLEIIMSVLVMAAMAAFLVPTGMDRLDLFSGSGLKACLDAGTSDCSDLKRNFIDSYRWIGGIVGWLNFVPAIVGVLLAAPIIMDFEQRTYRLAWTQSITRGRWLSVKLGMALLGSAVFSIAFTALLTWWYTPRSKFQDPFSESFNFEGAMPFVYTVFAVALALAVGALARRTIVAAIVTLVGFLGARIFVEDALRPHFMPPIEQIGQIVGKTPFAALDRAWIVSAGMIDAAGRHVSDLQVNQLCPPSAANSREAAFECLQSHGIVNHVLYQPADRFWTFQGIEAAIFLGASAVLLGLMVWAVSRRMR